MESRESFVELVVLEGMLEAEIIKTKMESFGIPVMLQFESIGRILGVTTDGLGRVSVMVASGRLDDARELIRQDKSITLLENEEESL